MKIYDKEYGHQTEEIEIPKELIFCDVFKTLSGDAKLLYCCMRAVQQKECNQKTDEDGKVYIEYPVKRIMQEFRCSERTQSAFWKNWIAKTESGCGKKEAGERIAEPDLFQGSERSAETTGKQVMK